MKSIKLSEKFTIYVDTYNNEYSIDEFLKYVDINDKMGSSMSKPSKSSQKKSNGDKTSISNESNSLKKRDKKNNKDFIKRNIQVKFS